MNWNQLNSEAALSELIQKSYETTFGVIVFKHSTRCAISSMAESRLSSSWSFDENLPTYYIDVLVDRHISNLVSEKYNVHHESPQLLLIKNDECVYHASHMNISVKNLKKILEMK